MAESRDLTLNSNIVSISERAKPKLQVELNVNISCNILYTLHCDSSYCKMLLYPNGIRTEIVCVLLRDRHIAIA